MGRPVASQQNKNFGLYFANVVTVPVEQRTRSVARSGEGSIFFVFASTFPQLVRLHSRSGLTQLEFNKHLQNKEFPLIRKRIRKKDSVSPRRNLAFFPPSTFRYAGRRWRNPDDAEDFACLQSSWPVLAKDRDAVSFDQFVDLVRQALKLDAETEMDGCSYLDTLSGCSTPRSSVSSEAQMDANGWICTSGECRLDLNPQEYFVQKPAVDGDVLSLIGNLDATAASCADFLPLAVNTSAARSRCWTELRDEEGARFSPGLLRHAGPLHLQDALGHDKVPLPAGHRVELPTASLPCTLPQPSAPMALPSTFPPSLPPPFPPSHPPSHPSSFHLSIPPVSHPCLPSSLSPGPNPSFSVCRPSALRASRPLLLPSPRPPSRPPSLHHHRQSAFSTKPKALTLAEVKGLGPEHGQNLYICRT